jgi:uncharacterized protein YndB with AHSA1/START domain
MRGPEGEEACGRATYREIIEPERIVYTDAIADAAGNVLAEMPEMLVSLIFAEQGGKTKLTTLAQFASAADLKTTLDMGTVEGLNQIWDRLEAYLVRGLF